MNGYLEVKTTVGSREEAQKLGEAIVNARLAACVQVGGPIQSTYWWNGSLEHSSEWLCTMKTTEAAFEALAELIKSLHSYKTPEIVATPIAAGSREYLDWISKETS